MLVAIVHTCHKATCIHCKITRSVGFLGGNIMNINAVCSDFSYYTLRQRADDALTHLVLDVLFSPFWRYISREMFGELHYLLLDGCNLFQISEEQVTSLFPHGIHVSSLDHRHFLRKFVVR